MEEKIKTQPTTAVEAEQKNPVNNQLDPQSVTENKLRTLLYSFFAIIARSKLNNKYKYYYFLHLVLTFAKRYSESKLSSIYIESSIFTFMCCDLHYLASMTSSDKERLEKAKLLACDLNVARLESYAKDTKFALPFLQAKYMTDGMNALSSAICQGCNAMLNSNFDELLHWAQSINIYAAEHNLSVDSVLEKLAIAMNHLQKSGVIINYSRDITIRDSDSLDVFFDFSPFGVIVDHPDNGPTYLEGENIKIDKIGILLRYLDDESEFVYNLNPETALYNCVCISLDTYEELLDD